MSSPSIFDIEGTARTSLREIINDYGAAALDDERLITSLLTDLLAGHPREATLIRAAARVRAASLLRAHAANRIPAHTAIEDVAARLGHEALIEPNAARWIVTEYATAVGLTPAAIPTPDLAARPDPAPTRIDSPPPVVVTPPPVPPVPAPTPPAPPIPAPIPPAPAPAGTAGTAAAPSSRIPMRVAIALPVALALVIGVAWPNDGDFVSYGGRLHAQWLLAALPLTITLVVVTALTRGDVRAWRGTAYAALGVYVGTTLLPWASGSSGPLRWLLDRFEFGPLQDGYPVYWLPVYAVLLAVLTHAVMKRLTTVARTGLLTALIPAAVWFVVSIAGYGYLIAAARDENFNETGRLVVLLVLVHAVCVGAIMLSRVPRLGGRR